MRERVIWQLSISFAQNKLNIAQTFISKEEKTKPTKRLNIHIFQQIKQGGIN